VTVEIPLEVCTDAGARVIPTSHFATLGPHCTDGGRSRAGPWIYKFSTYVLPTLKREYPSRRDRSPLRKVCGLVVTTLCIAGYATVVTLVDANSRGKKLLNVALCEALKSLREMRSYGL